MKAISILILTFTAVAFLISCTENPKQSEQWLQFRGHNAMGIAPESAAPPIDFGTNKKVLWKTKTPDGHSSPIIYKDNIIITGIISEEKKYLVWNISKNDGSVKWKKEIQVDTLERVHPVSSEAAATPVSDGQHIYCYFPPKGIVCLDFDGNSIWEKSIKFHRVLQGSGTSPILHEGKLILNHDNSVDPKLMVFDKNSGRLLWKKEFEKVPWWESCSWSTPIIWHNQVIIHRINEIVGYDMESGKIIWRFDIGTTGCATPVIVDSTLFVNAWMIRGEKSNRGEVANFDDFFSLNDINADEFLSKSEFPQGTAFSTRPEATDIENKYKTNTLDWSIAESFDVNNDDSISVTEWKKFADFLNDFSNHGLIAVKLGESGNITLSGNKWKIQENIPETPSVVVHNNLLYMVKNGGTVTCVNTDNGEIIYTQKINAPGSYLASPLYANGNVFLSSFNGKITIIKTGKDFEIVNQIDLKERIGASPVTDGDKLIIRTGKHLYAFGH